MQITNPLISTAKPQSGIQDSAEEKPVENKKVDENELQAFQALMALQQPQISPVKSVELKSAELKSAELKSEAELKPKVEVKSAVIYPELSKQMSRAASLPTVENVAGPKKGGSTQLIKQELSPIHKDVKSDEKIMTSVPFDQKIIQGAGVVSLEQTASDSVSKNLKSEPVQNMKTTDYLALRSVKPDSGLTSQALTQVEVPASVKEKSSLAQDVSKGVVFPVENAELSGGTGVEKSKGLNGSESKPNSQDFSQSFGKSFEFTPAVSAGIKKGPKTPEELVGSTDLKNQLSPGTERLITRTEVAPAILAAPVTGHVVQGSGAKERLSSSSLNEIGSQVRILTSLPGTAGGEMRIRLKPDNLGELSVQVRARGNQVGLRIQASDERAKRILEESIPHLKESLSTQNLQLSRVEVGVSVPHISNGDTTSQSFNQSSRDGQSWSDLGNNQGQQSQGRREEGWDRLMAQDLGSPGLVHARQRTQSYQNKESESGRLNVMA